MNVDLGKVNGTDKSTTSSYFQYLHEVGHSSAMIPLTAYSTRKGFADDANMQLNILRCSKIFSTSQGHE